MLSEIFTISKLIKIFSSPFQMAIVKHLKVITVVKIICFRSFWQMSAYFWPEHFLFKVYLTWVSSNFRCALLHYPFDWENGQKRLFVKVVSAGQIGFNIFVAFTLVGLILCLRCGNIHIWYIIYQPFDVFCGWWSADAACLFLPPALTDVGQTPYSSQPSKNTYTNKNENTNTNMDTNTDVSQTPYTSQPWKKYIYKYQYEYKYRCGRQAKNLVPMNGEYVYLSSFLHKNN